MITKQTLQNLLACVEISQKAGQIPTDAMMSVGMAYANAKAVFSTMSDSDTLIVNNEGASKKNSIQESEGESQMPAANGRAKKVVEPS